MASSSVQQVLSANMGEEKIKLFVSYAPDYREGAVSSIVAYLRQLGSYEIWTNKDNLTDRAGEYQAITQGINEADVFLCFYSNKYAECDQCRRDIKYADGKGKPILPIRVQQDYQPVGWLNLYFSGKNQIKLYNDWNSVERAPIDICKLIKAIVNEAKQTRSEPTKAFLEQAGVPYFEKSKTLQRKPMEDKILNTFQKIVRDQVGGMVVVYGEGGSGKTTLMAGLIKDAEIQSKIANQCGISRVVWLNCFKWRDIFDEKDFYQSISKLAEKMDAELQLGKDDIATKKFSDILRFYRERNIKCTYVFDDVFNCQIIESFLDSHGDVAPPVFFVITRQSFSQIIGERRLNACEICLEALTDSDIKQMLKTTFNLGEFGLDDQQLEKLASLCCGLPLIANLIASRITFDTSDVEGAYRNVMSDLSGELRDRMGIHDKYKSQSNLTVFTLLSFSLDQMVQSARMSYYAFLFFNPAEPVKIDDLAMLWDEKISIKNMTDVKWQCRQFELRSLVRRVEAKNRFEKEDRFLVHQTLFEAAIGKASKDLKLADKLTDDERLYKIRLKIISGEINREYFTDTGDHTIFVPCIKYKNGYIIHRAVQMLSAEDFAELLLMKSALSNKAVLAYNSKLIDSSVIGKMATDIRSVTLLLERAPQLVNFTNEYGTTAFHRALSNGNLEIVQFLLGKSPQLVNVTTNHGNTALHFASSSCLIKFLLEKAPQLVNITNNQGLTALHDASLRGNLEKANYLIEKAPELVNVTNKDGETALHYACSCGHLEIVKSLFDKAPQLVNVSNKRGDTALIVACFRGRLEIVKFLLENAPQLFAINSDVGMIAFQKSCSCGELEIMQFLFDKAPHLVNYTDTYGMTSLHHASKNGELKIVQFLFGKTPQLIYIQDTKFGMTALHYASLSGKLEIVKFILENEPQLVAIIDNKGETALHYAASKGCLEVVKCLLERAPQLAYIPNENDVTPLHCASSSNLEMVKIVLEKAPELVSTCTKSGNSALHLASLNGCLDIVRFLLEKAPHLVDIINKDGETALHTTSAYGRLDIFKFLCDKAPQLVNVRNGSNETALDIERSIKHGDVKVKRSCKQQ